MDKLANVLGNVATRINNLRYIMVIKRICCIDSGNYYGCFGTLFSAMVFDSENGLAQISFLRFRRIKAYRICHQLCHTKFLDHLCCFLIGIELAKLNKVDGVFPGIIAVMSYLSVNPTVYELVNENQTVIVENVLAKQYTDTKGLFWECWSPSFLLNFIAG